MDLIPEDVRSQIPPLGATEGEADPMIWAKLTIPAVGWTWYLAEMHSLPPDAIFRGYAVGWDEQYEYFTLAELEQIAAVEGVPLTYDATFTPCRLSVVRSREQGPSKFPLGEVVATHGAAGALHQADDHPLTYLKRHAHGGWGDVDAEDAQENELSLTQGFRLLSAYNLSDGTRLWIITEADRSVTTLLLPSEY